MRITTPSFVQRVERRTLLKAGLASVAVEIASPFVISARGEETVKMGMVEPLTGVYAQLAKAEIEGARLAAEERSESRLRFGEAILAEESPAQLQFGAEPASSGD